MTGFHEWISVTVTHQPSTGYCEMATRVENNNAQYNKNSLEGKYVQFNKSYDKDVMSTSTNSLVILLLLKIKCIESLWWEH